MGSQLMGHKRRTGDRFAPSPCEDDVFRQTETWWDIPRKRTLFGLKGPDSMTSGRDVVEAQDYRPPGDGYPMITQSGLFIESDSLKAAWSPDRKLEDTVAQLQRVIEEYRWGTRSGESSSAYETVGVYFHASSQIFWKI